MSWRIDPKSAPLFALKIEEADDVRVPGVASVKSIEEPRAAYRPEGQQRREMTSTRLESRKQVNWRNPRLPVKLENNEARGDADPTWRLKKRSVDGNFD